MVNNLWIKYCIIRQPNRNSVDSVKEVSPCEILRTFDSGQYP